MPIYIFIYGKIQYTCAYSTWKIKRCCGNFADSNVSGRIYLVIFIYLFIRALPQNILTFYFSFRKSKGFW